MTDKIEKEIENAYPKRSLPLRFSEADEELVFGVPLTRGRSRNVGFALEDVAELLGEEVLEEMLESVRDDTVEVRRRHLRRLHSAARMGHRSVATRVALKETEDLV